MTDRAPGNEMKDESPPDLNTPGFVPGTQRSEVECSIPRPSAVLRVGFKGLYYIKES